MLVEWDSGSTERSWGCAKREGKSGVVKKANKIHKVRYGIIKSLLPK